MKTQIHRLLNGLSVYPLPLELTAEIADKIDALDSCNVIEIKNIRMVNPKRVGYIYIKDQKPTARQDIEKILSEYSKK